MAPPRPIALHFEQFVGYDLYVHDRLSKDDAELKPNEDETNRICAWLNEKRMKEISERAFWVRHICFPSYMCREI